MNYSHFLGKVVRSSDLFLRCWTAFLVLLCYCLSYVNSRSVVSASVFRGVYYGVPQCVPRPGNMCTTAWYMVYQRVVHGLPGLGNRITSAW